MPTSNQVYPETADELNGNVDDVFKAFEHMGKGILIKESDWKIFRKKIIGWQENYMQKLNKEYIEILQRDENPAKNFWDLENRIFHDKKSVGVVIDMRRSMMFNNILSLLNEEIIQLDDLNDFSEEFQNGTKDVVNMLG